jgi:sulfide:quinone oxidoreductase
MAAGRPTRSMGSVDGRDFSVLIAGGGVAALEAALTLADVADGRTRVELLASEPFFWYRPTAVVEPFGLGEARHFDLGLLAERAGAGMTLGTLAEVDADAHVAKTTAGAEISYDALLIACGAVPTASISGAVTFRGSADTDLVRDLLDELERGVVRRLAIAVPWGATWPLPAYELALLTARRLLALDIECEVTLVTPEPEPLHLFGPAASDAVQDMFIETGVQFLGDVRPLEHDGRLLLLAEGAIPADRVVALPRLRGRRIDGLVQTSDCFIPVDDHCGVIGASDVFAAGDITAFPVKQGGIAAQQAVSAAEAIAVLAGATLLPCPFRPVLRGLLLTGADPAYLRHDPADAGASDWASTAPIWWPPSKIVGRRLTNFLASITDEPEEALVPPIASRVEVDVPLDPAVVARLATPVPDDATDVTAWAATRGTVASVMHTDVEVVGPGATLDAIAETMRRRGMGCTLVVSDEGELIGILTARDLLRAAAAGLRTSDAAAREWMTTEPVSIAPETPLEAAEETMTEFGIHRMPVVDAGEIVGLVGLRDVTRERADAPRLALGLGF